MKPFLVAFLLFLLPFVILPFGASQFETPKVIIAESIILLLLVVSIFSSSYDLHKSILFELVENTFDKLSVNFSTSPSASSGFARRIINYLSSYSINFALSKNKHGFILGSIVILSLIHLLFFQTDISFFGNQTRLQGIFLLWCLILFSLLSSKTSIPLLFFRLVPIFLALQFLIAIYLGANETGRAIGTLGEANSLAGYAVFTWPFIFFGKAKPKLVLTLITLLLTTGIIYVSGSRSGLIAFISQLVFLFCISKLKFSFSRTFFIIAILFISSIILPFFEKGGYYESRSEIWKLAAQTGLERPILGHGFGNIEIALHNSALKTGNLLSYQYIDSSHNIFLDYLVQGGIIGVILFCSLLCFTIYRFAKHKMHKELIILLGLITVLSFNPVSLAILIPLWWIIGKNLD